MAHVCARSSLCLRPTTFRASSARRSSTGVRCRHHLVRAAQSAGNADLFFVAQNNFKVCLSPQPQQSRSQTSPVTTNVYNLLQVQVKKEGCEQFEEIWKNRESHLQDTPGFIRFALLRGDEDGNYTSDLLNIGFLPCMLTVNSVYVTGEYISESHWASRQAFQDWTQSQSVSTIAVSSNVSHDAVTDDILHAVCQSTWEQRRGAGQEASGRQQTRGHGSNS